MDELRRHTWHEIADARQHRMPLLGPRESITTFHIAPDGQTETVQIVAWGPTAEAVCRHETAGDRVEVVGTAEEIALIGTFPQCRSWELSADVPSDNLKVEYTVSRQRKGGGRWEK